MNFFLQCYFYQVCFILWYFAWLKIDNTLCFPFSQNTTMSCCLKTTKTLACLQPLKSRLLQEIPCSCYATAVTADDLKYAKPFTSIPGPVCFPLIGSLYTVPRIVKAKNANDVNIDLFFFIVNAYMVIFCSCIEDIYLTLCILLFVVKMAGCINDPIFSHFSDQTYVFYQNTSHNMVIIMYINF